MCRTWLRKNEDEKYQEIDFYKNICNDLLSIFGDAFNDVEGREKGRWCPT